ncbi:MAG: hypothetical protein WCC74_01350 [Minisyncoccia bacterium]
MFNISGFLEKFKELSQKNSFIKKTVVEAIFFITGFYPDEKRIEVLGNKVKIKESSVLKNEIFLKKDKIFKKLIELGNNITKEIV